MNEKLLTAKEVSEQLQIALAAVYHLFNTNKLDGCIVGKKSIRFTRDQVAAYIERKSTNNAGAGEEQ